MRAVLFDVDGVLVHGYHARQELRRCWDVNLVQDFGIEREHFAQHYIFKRFIKEVLVGKAGLNDTLAEYFATFHPAVDPVEFVRYWLEKDAHLNTELLEVVEELAKHVGLSLYIATNQCHERAAYLMDDLGLATFFKDIFHSAKVGAIKPDTAYFEYIEATLALPPEMITFFDDTPAVIAAARERGWIAHEFTTCVDAAPHLHELLHEPAQI